MNKDTHLRTQVKGSQCYCTAEVFTFSSLYINTEIALRTGNRSQDHRLMNTKARCLTKPKLITWLPVPQICYFLLHCVPSSRDGMEDKSVP